jgi:hypothetical protein
MTLSINDTQHCSFECLYTDVIMLIIDMLIVIRLIVVRRNVIMLSVVAPFFSDKALQVGLAFASMVLQFLVS